MGTVSAKEQGRLDKKSWVDLDTDFVPESLSKKAKPDKKFKAKACDDPTNPARAKNSDRKKKSSSPSLLDRRNGMDFDEGNSNDIEDFVTQPEKPVIFVEAAATDKKTSLGKKSNGDGKVRAKAKNVKAENKWGLEITDITASEKKKIRNRKQSTLDRYMGASAEKGGGSKVRGRLYDSELEKAKQLSMESFRKEKQMNGGASPKEDDSELGVDGTAKAGGPGYAYVNEPVRKQEERRKLNGYDCSECREYYRAKLEEGMTEEEVKRLMNRCSRHRAVHKPALTPDKFWDPDIIEGNPDSPRNKTQAGSPLKSRSQRRTKEDQKKIDLMRRI